MKFNAINKITLAAFIVLSAAFLFSCQKENSKNETAVNDQEAATYSQESTEAEASFDDVNDIALSAADEEEVTSENTAGGRVFLFAELRLRIGDCAKITIEPNDSTYPKTVVIDFGDGCWGRDGKFRRGAMVLHFTGPLRRPGSVITLTFREFYLNRAHIQGQVTFENLSENGVHKWSLKVNDGAVTFPNGRGYKYEGGKVVTQIEGMDTRTIRDDVYQIEGRSKTVFANGKTITLNTEDPLIKKVSCHWISEGTLKIVVNDRVFKLDYGFPNNGDCDNKALLLWNDGNDQKVIILP